jgi:site-specific DNA-methyltransferase (adenine-specific)
MNAQELIKKLKDLDVKIWAEGDKIKWDAPSGAIKDELWAEMKEHKLEILSHLKAKENDAVKTTQIPILAPRVVKRGTGDFPGAYRPCRLSEVYGQDEVKKVIAHGLNNGTLPHILLFQGASGTGKTTIGRIVAMGLNCENGPTCQPCLECNSCKSVLSGCSFAYLEYDAAHLSGVNSIRTVKDDFSAAPLTGERSRIVLFDECHCLSQEAQGALLKPTDDDREHLYIIFCTTEHEKVLKTLRNRCMEFKFTPLPAEQIRTLLSDVCSSEKLLPDSAKIENIIKEAEGMPRNALFLLQKAVIAGELDKIGKDTDSTTSGKIQHGGAPDTADEETEKGESGVQHNLEKSTNPKAELRHHNMARIKEIVKNVVSPFNHTEGTISRISIDLVSKDPVRSAVVQFISKKDNLMFINNISLGDCFEAIDNIQDSTVDLCLTSPPYANVKSYGCNVKIVHPDEYVDWLLPLLHGIHRVLKPTGSLILNINDRIVNKQRHPYVHELIVRAVKETSLRLYDTYTWVKKGTKPTCNTKRLNDWTEHLIHFCKDENHVKWNMDAVREPHNLNTIKRFKSPVSGFELKVDGDGKVTGRSRKIIQLNEKGKTPCNVFYFPTSAAVRGKIHPATFHIKLPTWFIKTLTDEGDLVLDPFCGTGTTCLAAKALGRRFIGIEISPLYHEDAVKRVENAVLAKAA